MRIALLLIAGLLAAPVRAAKAPPSPEELKAALAKVEAVFLSFREEAAPRAGEVELGRLLFFDPRLSRDLTISCASCHQPAMAFTDGLKRARGAEHKELRRNTPTLLDVAGRAPFFRDGRSATLEAQALVPIQDPEEMGLPLKDLEARLARVPDYARRFRETYGGAPAASEVARALAAFQRTLKAPRDGAFDRFRAGVEPLTPEAARGLVLFAGKARCVQCHAGPDFTDGFFHNNGHKREEPADPGRFAVIPVDAVFRAFKTPSLRDAAWTPPYFHDGSLPDLRSVVDFYDRGGDESEGRDPLIKPLNLSEAEKQDLLSFLSALTSSPAPVNSPVLPLDEEPAPGGDALSGLVAAVARAAAQGEPRGVRDGALAVETQARVAGTALAGAGAEVPSCLTGAAARARALAYGPVRSAAEERAAADALAAAWADCAASTGLVAAPPPSEDPAAAAARGEALLAGAPEPASEAACVERFDPEAMVGALREGRYGAELASALGESALDDAIRWKAYRALSSGRLSDCGALDGLARTYNGIRRDAAAACREWSSTLRFSRALMSRSSDWPEACRESLAQGYDRLAKTEIASVCAAIIERVDDPAALCRSLAPRYLDDERGPSCAAEFAQFAKAGGGADCGAIAMGAEVLRERCEALKGLRRVPVEGLGACGAGEMCRAMAGDEKAVSERLRARLAAKACALTARAANSARRAALLRARREAVSAREGAEAAEKARPAGDRAAAARLDAAAERAALVEAKADAALGELK